MAKKGETREQKNIWKLCFGDADSYIDLYYANRYKEEETALLLCDGEIVSMLSMLPVKVVTATGERLDAAMLYAIATRPKYQGRGYVSKLIDFSNNLLFDNKQGLSLLVPASESLFGFYNRRGYRIGFYLHETVLSYSANTWLTETTGSPTVRVTITPTTPENYNQRREKQLAGRIYVSYRDEEIAYQQKLSLQTGADIYALDCNGIQGCAALERINSDKVLIKELLLPPDLIQAGIACLTGLLPAREYILRLPGFRGPQYNGKIRPFAMFKIFGQGDALPDFSKESGYLGLAFD